MKMPEKKQAPRITVFGCAFALVVCVVICVILSACCLSPVLIPVATETTVSGIIVDSYVKRYDNADYFHIVIQFSDGTTTEVFQNRDEPIFGKWNSADIQQELRSIEEDGEECVFRVAGFRSPLFSQFRNVVEVVSCTTPPQ